MLVNICDIMFLGDKMRFYNEVVNLETNKLKKNYTFCVLADIHNTDAVSNKLWTRLIHEISSQNPDYIFIAGDIIQEADDLINDKVKKGLEYLLSEIQLIAPTFISLGNHDLKNGKVGNATDTLKYFKSLETQKLFILDNETIELEEMTITGFSPRYESYYEKNEQSRIKYFVEDLEKCLFAFNKDKYNIFLTHSPEIISEKESLELTKEILKNIDLVLCGHMHDGYIPKIIQKLGLVKFDKGIRVNEGDSIKDTTIGIINKCRGKHIVLNSTMIVTMGIRKLSHNNFIFNKLDKLCAKDFATVKLLKKD